MNRPPDTDSFDTRIAQAEAEAEKLHREITELRAERERVEQEHAAQERAEREKAAQAERDKSSAASPAPSAKGLLEAVLRYAVACGAVDVNIALLRARNPSGEQQKEAIESLADALQEQNEASTRLRALAREIQQARSVTDDTIFE